MCYQKALEINPDYPEALNNLGLMLNHQNEFQEAETYFRKALEINPDYAEA